MSYSMHYSVRLYCTGMLLLLLALPCPALPCPAPIYPAVVLACCCALPCSVLPDALLSSVATPHPALACKLEEHA